MPSPTYDQALDLILPHVPRVGEERVPLAQTLCRVLAEDVKADRDQPPFDRSAMDGFAVRSADITPKASLPVIGAVAAGGDAESFTVPIAPGTARRIATGAPLPVGADATIPIEQAAVSGEASAQRVAFVVDSAKPWQNVHRRASDAALGSLVIRAGTRIAPHHVGILAAVGNATPLVKQRPRITVLTTGDEVVPCDTPTSSMGPQQIRNSNGPMLLALLRSQLAGDEAVMHHEHLPDDPEVTLAAAREALSRSHLVITNGGVSVGERDFLPSAWRRLGLETILHGVNIQPGKPVLVVKDDCKLVLGLPGNPVSVLCTAHLFVWPVLRRMADANAAPLPWRSVTLAGETKATAKRQLFRAAKLNADGSATVLPWHGSGDLMHTADADGWVRLPMQDEPVRAGTVVPWLDAIR